MTKMIKEQAKGISRMLPEELYRIIDSPESKIEQIEAATQEGYQRREFNVFYKIAKRPQLLNNEKIYDLTLKYMENPDYTKLESSNFVYAIIFRALLDSSVSKSFVSRIKALALRSPEFSAIAMLEKNSPSEVIEGIYNPNRLNIPALAPSTHPILVAMISAMSIKKIKWTNTESAKVLLLRSLQNPSDKFILDASKQNLGFSVASWFISASQTSKNLEISKALKTNPYAEVKTAFGINELTKEGIDSRKLDDVIELIKVSESIEHIKTIWEIIQNSIFNMSALTGGVKKVFDTSERGEPILIDDIYIHTLNGESVVSSIIDKDPNMASDIIELIQKNIPSQQILKSSSFSKLIHVGLTNVTTKDKVLSLPEDYFKLTMMTPADRQIINEYFHPQEQITEQDSYVDDIMGCTKNWYRKDSST